MSKLNLYHYMGDLHNVNEGRVWNMLSEYLEGADSSKMCLCGICLVDIVAITLNGIPAQYQTEHNLTVALERVPDVEIYRQLKKAVAIVSTRPHH